MPVARDIFGTVFKNGTAVLMARIVDEDGQPLAREDILALSYTVHELDAQHPDTQTPIAGHQNQPLDVDSVVFDTLQLDPLWDVDAVGYNFKHVLDASINAAFPTAGLFYRVEHSITPVGAQELLVRFQLQAI